MKIRIEKSNTCYLEDTTVENIFINEYMPDAPCDFVKVYLLSLMCAQMRMDVSTESIAKQLHITPETVDKAIQYWCKSGLIKKSGENPVFLSMKERLYGNPKEESVIKSDKSARLLDNGEIAEMFSRIEAIAQIFISGTQMNEITSWIEDYNATTEIIIKAFEYGRQRGKTNLRYVGAIVKNWTEKGLFTKADAERYLSEMDETYYIYRRVMDALGFNRNPGEREREIISYWIDEMGCSMQEILDACAKTSGISNPNINYVNKVLQNKRKKDKGEIKVSKNLIMQQYEKYREEARTQAEKRKEEVYLKLPRIREIDSEIMDIGMEMSDNLMSGNIEGNKKITEKMDSLEKEKLTLLTANDIPQDYMEPRYHCRICQDTGVGKDGNVCQCFNDVSNFVKSRL